jgi:HK97 family phage prohead protease
MPEVKNETEIERRNLDIEFRIEQTADKKPKIIGHAAVFNKLSEPMFDFREQIAPGTFAQSIKKDDVRALHNHDANYILGRNKAGTLKLKEDDIGLAIEIDPPDTQWARDLQESIRRGDVSQMSFGFVALKDEWEYKKKGDTIRTITEVKLFDVSTVVYPAYPQTTVAVRDYIKALKEAEAITGERPPVTGPGDTSAKLRWKLR